MVTRYGYPWGAIWVGEPGHISIASPSPLLPRELHYTAGNAGDIMERINFDPLNPQLICIAFTAKKLAALYQRRYSDGSVDFLAFAERFSFVASIVQIDQRVEVVTPLAG